MMQLHDCLRNHHAQACARLFFGALIVAAEVALTEQLAQVVFAHANARIGYCAVQIRAAVFHLLFAVFVAFRQYFVIRLNDLRGDGDCAFGWTVLVCVADKVRHDLNETGLIAEHQRQVFGHVDDDFLQLVLKLAMERTHRFDHDVAEADWLQIDFKLSSFGFRGIAQIVNDVYIVGRTGNLVLNVLQKEYLREAPIGRFPPKTHLEVNAALSDVTTAGASLQSRIAYAFWSGRPYLLSPADIKLDSNMNFNVQLNWPEGVQAITNAGRIGVVLDGVMFRKSQ